MEFLNRAIAQITDLLRSMTPGARLATGLLLVLVPISLAYLFTYHNSSPDDYLLNGVSLEPAELEAMQLAFGKANLNNFQVEGTKIRIPHAQQAAYLAALAANNALPQHCDDIVPKTLESSNLWISSKQREEMVQAANERKLGLIIRHMKGIQDASVMYDPGIARGFGEPAMPTASVSVKPLGSEQLSEAHAHAICTLLCKSIANLKPEAVAVIDLSTGTEIGHGDSEGPAGQGGGQYGDLKRRYEQEYKQKIREALSYVPGVTVTPNVELDPELSHTTETVKHDPKTVPMEVEEKTRSNTSDAAAPGGRPGYQAQQGPNAPMQLSNQNAKGAHTKEEDNESRQYSVPALKTMERVEKAPLTPKRVTVSIGVPASYFTKVWRERNPAEPGSSPKTPEQAALDQIRQEVTTEIRDHVANLLPTVEGTGAIGQLVKVTAFPDIKPPELPLPSAGENTVGWLMENWTTIALIALAFFGLWMLRSLVRSASAGVRSETASMAHHADETGGATGGATGAAKEEAEAQEPVKAGSPRLRRFDSTGPSLRDELAQLVQEDPDAAANVLRTWIGTTTSNKS